MTREADRPQELLFALAQQLAQEFMTSRTSRATVAALCTLLPGLQYYSLGVLSPSSSTDCVITSSSCACAGPSLLSLHSVNSSAVGMVGRKGDGIQASLDGVGGSVLSYLSDVAEMIQAAPTCKFTICLPIKSPYGCTGGLLLGFSSLPAMNHLRRSTLTALCYLLSTCMVEASEKVTCMVEQLVGVHSGCASCDQSWQPAIPDSAYETRCDRGWKDGSSSGDDSAFGGQSSLLTPIDEHPEEEATAGGPPEQYPRNLQCPCNTSPHSFSFDKSLVLSVTEEEIRHQRPVVLTYVRKDLEEDFTRWYQVRLAPIDFLSSVSVLMAACLLFLFCPKVFHATSSDMLRGGGDGGGAVSIFGQFKFVAPVLVPLLWSAVSKASYLYHREVAVGAVRVYLISLLSLMPAAVWATGPQSQIVGLWISSWVEMMFMSAWGLPLRLVRHIPLQATLTAILTIRCITESQVCDVIARTVMISSGYRYQATIGCALLGFVLPTAAVYFGEARSRQVFARELADVACLDIDHKM